MRFIWEVIARHGLASYCQANRLASYCLAAVGLPSSASTDVEARHWQSVQTPVSVSICGSMHAACCVDPLDPLSMIVLCLDLLVKLRSHDVHQ